VAAQVGRLEGLECEVDQLQNVLQSVATELESGHQQAQVCLLSTKTAGSYVKLFRVPFLQMCCNGDYEVAMVQIKANS